MVITPWIKIRFLKWIHATIGSIKYPWLKIAYPSQCSGQGSHRSLRAMTEIFVAPVFTKTIFSIALMFQKLGFASGWMF
jgi:ABC-type Co2+ transport system permease subunit